MKKVLSIDKIFAESLIEEENGASETRVMDFSIKEGPCAFETRGRVLKRF